MAVPLHQNSRFTPKWYIILKGWQMAAARDIGNTKYICLCFPGHQKQEQTCPNFLSHYMIHIYKLSAADFKCSQRHRLK